MNDTFPGTKELSIGGTTTIIGGGDHDIDGGSQFGCDPTDTISHEWW